MPLTSESKKQQQRELAEQQRQLNLRPTAKRSPSILVTDVRYAQNSRVSAPFAGHRFNSVHQLQDNTTSYGATGSRGNVRSNGSNAVRRGIPTKFSNISVSSITSGMSDIPSGRKRPTPPSAQFDNGAGNNQYGNPTGSRRLTPRNIPKLTQSLPSRLSKKSQRLVLIPDEEETLYYELVQQEKTWDQIDPKRLHSYQRSRAEKLTKQQRAKECPRVTAYLIADGFKLKMTSKFLRKHHLVQPRLYDEVLYIPYSLPLLPGSNGFRVQSNNSERLLPQKQMMENFIDKTELKDHHYEYYSGEDMGGQGDHIDNNIDNLPPGKPIDLGRSDLMNTGNNEFENFNPGEPQFFPSPSSSPVNNSSVLFENDPQDKVENSAESNEQSHEDGSKIPDLMNHAELFIFGYGVVVFWNFSEVHEKNILADLAFAKRGDIYDDDEENGENLIQIPNSLKEVDLDDDDDDEDDEDEDEDGDFDEPLLIRPIHDQDIECDEFHFEYNSEISLPRIYNDMITLKTGDHLIKLTISHSLLQSTKLCYYESRMSRILTSISKLPKILALTGGLYKIKSRKVLLIKTGKLFQIRNEVNLLSNVLDTPEFFWSMEPSLHPLYNAIRDYLEIDQRVEVINDRCKVFLDFFDIISDSIAEKNMNKITWWVIYVLSVMIVVSCIEIFIRYLLIKRNRLDGR